jgi:hypothetical protein
MIASTPARLSAGFLATAGLPLLFASDALIKASAPVPAVRLAAIPFGVLATVYAVLLLRGPLDRPAT